jgi:phosphatidate phosphatase APP1
MDVPTPVSKWAEVATIPTISDIKDTIKKSALRQL